MSLKPKTSFTTQLVEPRYRRCFAASYLGELRQLFCSGEPVTVRFCILRSTTFNGERAFETPPLLRLATPWSRIRRRSGHSLEESIDKAIAEQLVVCSCSCGHDGKEIEDYSLLERTSQLTADLLAIARMLI